MREKVLLAGPCLGELWWCFERFAPYVFWKKKQLEEEHGKVMLVCLERRDRFDIWGTNCDILVPLDIKGDGTLYKQDCFRLTNFPEQKYELLIKEFRNYFSKYEVLDHIYPNIKGKEFQNKNQFPKDKKIYSYSPRALNKELLENYINTQKPIVTIAPRYRASFARNWSYWARLYDLIYQSKELKKFCFVICGKEPDYVPDRHNRFHDINKIQITSGASLIGITIELLKKSILTVGSQSAIPNISLLLGTPVLEWGNQKKEHTIDYNVMGTPVTFLEDPTFSIDVRIVFTEMLKILREWEKNNDNTLQKHLATDQLKKD